MGLIRLNNQSLTNVTSLPSGVGNGILQIKQHVEDGQTYYTYASGTDLLLSASNANDSASHLSVSITPSSTSSKILLMSSIFHESSNQNSHDILFAFHRGSTKLGASESGSKRAGIANTAMGYTAGDANSTPDTCNLLFVDSPSSTSALTYTVSFNANHAAQLYVNRTYTFNNDGAHEMGVSSIVAMEIAG